MRGFMSKKGAGRMVRITTIIKGKVTSRVAPVEGNRFLGAWAAVHPPVRKRQRT